MRKDEFVMRGQTPSTSGENTEVLNFSGFKAGYAYKLTEFSLYPSTGMGATNNELFAAITAGKSAADPLNPNFNDESLIGTAQYRDKSATTGSILGSTGVINDTFLITQNLQLTVKDEGGGSLPVNWQCRFKPVKMAKAEEAVANYKQFLISDGS
jgi:hypothetical protein